MEKYRMVAPCLFGVEGILADELRRMEAEDVTAENGRVLFSGGPALIARANICSRYAERILICLGEFPAASFTQMFDGVKALPWENYIGSRDAFPVKGWSIGSQLHSIPDCQSIVKKAIVERLKSRYNLDWFQESGPVCQVQFSLFKDRAALMIDTSGEGLHKRGYRRQAGEAPLKETLAAAMAYLARLYPDTQMFDPFCGSGTILIESAMLAANLAPGLRRGFAAERMGFLSAAVWQTERQRAADMVKRDLPFRAFGSDLDPAAVALTNANAQRAGVGKLCRAETGDIRDFTPPDGRCVVITNPPYGERLLDIKAAEALYTIMGRQIITAPGKRYYVITPDDDFEKIFGRPADKRRKLYNGMIKCQLYMYFR